MIVNKKSIIIEYFFSFKGQTQANNSNTKVYESFTDQEGSRLDLRVPILVWVSMGEPFIPIDGEYSVLYVLLVYIFAICFSLVCVNNV